MAVLLLPLILAACEDVEDRVANHHERGMAFLESGETAKASLEFRNALRFDEEFVPSRLELAKILEEEGNFQGSVQNFRRVIELEPENLVARQRVAQILLAAGRFDEALTHSEAAYKIAPNDVDVLVLRAAVALRLDNLDVARTASETALTLDPLSSSAILTLAGYHAKNEDPDQALDVLESFIEVDDSHIAVHLARMQILENLGRSEELGRSLREVVEKNPEITGLRQTLVTWMMRQTPPKVDDALEQMRLLADLEDTDRIGPVLNLVRFLNAYRSPEAARAELEARIEQAEDKYRLRSALFTLLLEQQDIDAAKSVARDVIAMNDENQAAARLLLAEAHLLADELAESRTELTTVLETDEKNPRALHLSSAVHLRSGNLDAAILDARASLNEEPRNANLLALVASAYERNGNLELASESLASAMQRSEYSPSIVMAYVAFLGRTSQVSAIDVVLTEAANRRPNDRQILTALAQLRLNQQNWTAAEELARRLRALDDNAGTQLLAAALSSQQRFNESIDVLRDIAGTDDGSGGSMSALVQVYLRAGETEQAERFIAQVLETDPDNLQALLLRGLLHSQLGRFDAAEEDFRRLVAERPDSTTAYRVLVQLLLGTDRRDEADAVLAEGIENSDDPGPLRLIRASQFEVSDNIGGAISEYRTLLSTSPDSIIAANNLAALLADYEYDNPESVALASSLARRLRGSGIPAFRDTYGWVQYLEGNYDEALDSLLVAVEGLPNNPWVQFHLGMTYAKLEQPEKAREHLERARELGGDDFLRLPAIEETLASLATAETAN